MAGSLTLTAIKDNFSISVTVGGVRLLSYGSQFWLA
jgi:hypothetical protein